MVDVNDDANGRGYRRVEVLTGPGRRRRWSEEAKARIVAETLAPGAVIAEVARRWQVCSQQVFTWRREMRYSALPPFVPIVEEPSVALQDSTPSPCIEIQVADALVRVLPDTDPALLVMVLRALRASAA
jgi:transposase